MFRPSFRKAIEPLVPKIVMRMMDPFHTALYRKLEETARKIPAGARVLDAGGETLKALKALYILFFLIKLKTLEAI